MPTPVPFEDQLLRQAEDLSKQDRTRPNQASVRRAVSAAYYALFHAMISEANKVFLPARAKPVKDVVARTFMHAEMAEASKRFSNAARLGTADLPAALQACHPAGSIDTDVGIVCDVFTDLQDARHRADYDLSTRVSRNEAVRAVREARTAVAACRRAASRTENEPYFISLLLWRKLRRD